MQITRKYTIKLKVNFQYQDRYKIIKIEVESKDHLRVNDCFDPNNQKYSEFQENLVDYISTEYDEYVEIGDLHVIEHSVSLVAKTWLE